MAYLAELGYDTFTETDHGLVAYIPMDGYDAAALVQLASEHPQVHVEWRHVRIPWRNWNAEWESSFDPVEVDGLVRVRAHFHPTDPAFMHELVVTPRMSFGTGHHGTTRMMVRALLGMDLVGAVVCDLGCGTGVLAMLCERLGARMVHAVDIDPNAVDNARENVSANGCVHITVEKGDAGWLKGRGYQVILANIERNTLLRDLPALREALLPGAALLLSGFTVVDVDAMHHALRAQGLQPVEALTEGEWALVGARKSK
jgi:ribosomal protein L11 methyltransferase